MAEDAEHVDAEMAEADVGGSGSDDDSDSSGSDFEELTISPEDTQLLMKLEQQLQDNPSLYDSHVQVRAAVTLLLLQPRLCLFTLLLCHAFPLTDASLPLCLHHFVVH